MVNVVEKTKVRKSYYEVFAERMYSLRIRFGFTSAEVAKACGVSKRDYENYENCISKPSVSFLIEISKFYDVSVDYLMGRVCKEK